MAREFSSYEKTPRIKIPAYTPIGRDLDQRIKNEKKLNLKLKAKYETSRSEAGILVNEIFDYV